MIRTVSHQRPQVATEGVALPEQGPATISGGDM